MLPDGRRTRTTVRAAAASVARAEWARSCVSDREWKRYIRPYLCEEASAHLPDLSELKWRRAKRCPWDARLCAFAARGGHLEVLKWLRAKGCPCDARACCFAACGGHLEVLKWLRAEGCPNPLVELLGDQGLRGLRKGRGRGGGAGAAPCCGGARRRCGGRRRGRAGGRGRAAGGAPGARERGAAPPGGRGRAGRGGLRSEIFRIFGSASGTCHVWCEGAPPAPQERGPDL